MNRLLTTRTLFTLLLGLFSTSCISNQGHRSAIADRDNEILKLREGRSRMRAEIESQQSLIDSLNAQLSEASSRASSSMNRADQIMNTSFTPPATTVSSFPTLDELGVTYGVRDGNVVLTIPSSISFGSGKASLSSEGKRALKEVGKTLSREYPRALYFIEGYTDNDPIRKSAFANNRELSIARAKAVHAHLVEEEGIEDERCVVAGHGPYRNIAPNDSAANKAKNRRVEIVVHSGS